MLGLSSLLASAQAESSESGDCLSVVKFRRRVRSSCWVSFIVQDRRASTDSQRFEVCLSREQWMRELARRQPSCWVMPSFQNGQWQLDSVTSFDRPKEIGSSPSSWRFRYQGEPSRTLSGESVWRRWISTAVRSLERERERFSMRLAPYDQSGWFRQWFLGESPREEKPGQLRSSLHADPRLFFFLGHVHVLTTAGVHLLMLSSLMSAFFVLMGEGVFWFFPGLPYFVFQTLRRVFSVARWLVFAWVWALSGWRWGLVRPLLLIGIQSLSKRQGWRWDRGWPLMMAVSLESILALVVQEEGSWGRAHYFLAVWGGLWGARDKSGFWAHLGMAWGSWLWVAPLQLVHDGWMALATPLLSLVGVPIAGGLLLPLGLISEVLHRQDSSGFQVGFESLQALGSLLLAFTQPVAFFPGATWVLKSPSLWVLALGVFGVFFLRLVLSVRGKQFLSLASLGVFLILLERQFGFFDFRRSDVSHSLVTASHVVQLDVGQGDAALIQWEDADHRQQFAAMDLGSAWASTPEKWISALARRGASGLDVVVLTHLDEDHAGALVRILPGVPVRCLVLPEGATRDPRWSAMVSVIQRYPVVIQESAQGCFPFAWVSARSFQEQANGVMAGVLVPFSSGGGYLNLGDSGTRRGVREHVLLERLKAQWPEQWSVFEERRPGPRKAQRIWKVSHHGSRHSSALSVWKALEPTQAWISVGLRNRYGHPSPEVLEAFRTHGVLTSRTDLQGGLIYSSEP
jgi:beta-lactamase superfamily II metal-dependent hydrolase